MAAGIFEIIKSGDIRQLEYSATSFNSGKTITAIPYDPSGAVQTTVTFTQLGTTGKYQYNWDSTGKALGTWTFMVHENATTNAFIVVQVVDASTLGDTIFSGIVANQTSILSALNDAGYGLAKIDSDVLATKTDVDAVKADVESGTSGLAAIKSAVDAITTAVGHIQNNTLNTLALPASVDIPSTGSTVRRAYLNVFNENGGLVDPDSNHIQAQVFLPDGTDVTTSYLTGTNPIYMVRDGLGQYHQDFTINNAATSTALTFKFSYAEGGNAFVRDGIVILDYPDADNSGQLADIDTVVNATQTTVNTINTNVNTIESNIVAAMGTGFVGSTDSLHALQVAITSALSGGVSLTTITNNIATLQNDVEGSGFNSATDSLAAISSRIYTGGVAY